MTQSFGDPGGGEDVTRTATVNLQANTSGYAQQMAAAGQQTSMLGAAVDGLSAKMDGLTKRAGRKLELFSASSFASLSGMTADAAAFQKQMGTLAATSAVLANSNTATGSSFAGLKADVQSAFTKFPIARGDAVALTSAISNMGVTGARDIGSLDQTFVKLGASTGESMTGLASGLIQLSRLMGNTSAASIGNYANSLLTVSKNAGVSASGVLEFAQAIAPMARQAGIGEAAVLGISTAFSKAGADGYLAANTFNSIISDITNDVQTGSPQLAKYASFIGKTSTEFKKMPGQQQITAIFDAIAKGGPQALSFVNELGIGTRGMSAIQAVAKTGGLSQAISTAEGSSHDQTNLNKGSSAAFNNLTDSLASVRNQFTTLGDAVGGPLLGPLSMLAKVFAGFLTLVNRVVKDMGPLPAILGVLAGSLSLLAGIVIAKVGMLSTLALARMVTRQDSGPRAAYTQGRLGGAAMAAGKTEEEAHQSTAAGRMYAASQKPGGASMPKRASVPYMHAFNKAAGKEPPDAAAAAAGPGFVARMRANFHQGVTDFKAGGATEPLPAGPIPPPPEPPVASTAPPVVSSGAAASARSRARAAATRVAAMAAKTVTGTATYVADAQSKSFSDVSHGGLTSSGYPGGVGNVVSSGVKATVAATNAEIKARVESGTVIKGMTHDVIGAAKAVGTMGVEAAQAGVKMGAVAAGAVARTATGALLPAPIAKVAVGAGGLAAQGIGKAAGAIGGAAKAIGGAAFSLPGMLALGIGLPAITGLMHTINSKTAAADSSIADNLNPLAKYNDALGIATTNLASFASGLKSATPTAGTASTATTIAGAQAVTGTDVANYAHGKSADKNTTALEKYGGKGKVAAATQLMNSYGITDPKQLDLFKQNLLASGFSQDDTSKVLASYKPGAAVDYTKVAKVVNASEGKGAFATNQSKTGGTLTAATLSGIDLTKQSDLQTHSAGYAQTKELQSELSLLKAQGSGVTGGAGMKALAGTLATIAGTSTSKYESLLAPTHYAPGDARTGASSQKRVPLGGKDAFDATAFNKLSDTGKEQYLIKTLGDTKEGKAKLTDITGSGVKGVTDPTKMTAFLNKTFGISSDKQTGAARASSLGRFATTDTAVVNATEGAGQGDPVAMQAAMTRLASHAIKTAGSTAKASASLNALADVLGGTGTNQGKLLIAAAAWARTLQSFKLPTMSRNAQLGATLSNLKADTAAAEVPGASAETVAQAADSRKAYESAKESQRQYLISVYQQAQAYGTQMKRGQEDRNLSLKRGQEDFQLQMLQSSQDYDEQTLRSKQDFATQMKRQAQSAAEQIYDPFSRVQNQYTTDAGTLEQNLTDQNQRIAKQTADLGKLRKLGVSQSAIDTLQLSDPKNAQQTDNIVNGIASDPKLVAKINASVQTRIGATTKLTQSGFNESFRNTVTDFNLALNRAAQDYDKAHTRAEEAQSRSLSRMAQDYKTMVSRSGADLKTSMTEIYGSFGKVFGNSMSMVTSQLGKYAPAAASMIEKNLDQLKSKYPQLFSDSYTGHTPTSTAGDGGGGAGGAIRNIDITKTGKLIKHGHADGGIAVNEHYMGDGGAEALIPLAGERGKQFMAGMYQAVAKSVVMQMHTAPHPMMPRGPSSTTISYDQSTTVTGNTFELKGDNAADVIKELQKKDRLGKLTSPARH